MIKNIKFERFNIITGIGEQVGGGTIYFVDDIKIKGTIKIKDQVYRICNEK